jgi:ankyrin repeat protein
MHWAALDDSRAKLAGVIAARDPGLVNASDLYGETPLHVAAVYGSEAAALAAGGREALVRALLTAGADTNAKDDENGCTPLHWAVEQGSEDAARALLAAGADKNATNNRGETPLHYAQQEGNAALVALLS